MTRLKNIPDFMKMPVVGIVRNMPFKDFTEVLPVYYEAGLKIIEVTMNTPGVTEMIQFARKHFDKKLIVGAGTVCNTADVNAAVNAGASFIVTPILAEDVIAECLKKDLPVITGAFTPTEIYRAWMAGSSIVKVFPAASLGLQYIKEVRAPLNEIDLMPTGGIDDQNIESFFKAGAVAAGVGGKLFNEAMIREKNWNGLIEHFATYVKAIRNYQRSSVATPIPAVAGQE